jgi:hypothetical protein
LAVVLLVATRVVPAALRAVRSVGSGLRGDRPAAFLRFAVRGLAADGEDWGRAMCSELEHVRGTRARWRFSLGCVWAVELIRARATIRRPAGGALGMRALALAGIAGALILAAYGLVAYPGLRSSSGVWPSTAAFVAVMVAYAVIALALSSGASKHERLARRYGLGGGAAVGAAWFLIVSPTAAFKGWVAIPLAVALLGPACVAAAAGRSARDAKTATHAAAWSGIVGGLLAFVVWVSATYVRAGRPYDSGLLRDFHRSGAPDLATYAVGESLGSGIVLLILVPTVALALGSFTGRLAARPSRG